MADQRDRFSETRPAIVGARQASPWLGAMAGDRVGQAPPLRSALAQLVGQAHILRLAQLVGRVLVPRLGDGH